MALAACVLAACGPSQADVAADRQSLKALLAGDQEVSQVLWLTDTVVAKGHGKMASQMLTKDAIPLAQKNRERASATQVKTPWGRAELEKTKKLVEDRRASLDSYVKALDTDEVEAVIKELEAQKLLEKRGLELSSEIDRQPGGS